MRILKSALVVYLLAFYVGLGVFALPSDTDRNTSSGLVMESVRLMCPRGMPFCDLGLIEMTAR